MRIMVMTVIIVIMRIVTKTFIRLAKSVSVSEYVCMLCYSMGVHHHHLPALFSNFATRRTGSNRYSHILLALSDYRNPITKAVRNYSSAHPSRVLLPRTIVRTVASLYIHA